MTNVPVAIAPGSDRACCDPVATAPGSDRACCDPVATAPGSDMSIKTLEIFYARSGIKEDDAFVSANFSGFH